MKSKDQILKIKAVVLYILGRVPEGMDYIHLTKLLYFAQKEHLVQYGLPIMDDSFYAKKHGPVPSLTYKVLKFVEKGENFEDATMQSFKKSLRVEKHDDVPIVFANSTFDRDELSKSNIKVLDRIIDEYLDVNSFKLAELAHDKAWKEAYNSAKRTGDDTKIPIYDIAAAGGAKKAMLNVIRERQWVENQLR